MFSISDSLSRSLESFIWRPSFIVLLLVIGIVVTLKLRIFPFYVHRGIRSIFGKRKILKEIPNIHLFARFLSHHIGIGNLIAVGSALAFGGLGAIFWMWVVGLVSGALKFSEIIVSTQISTKNKKGENIYSPLYYLRKGLEDKLQGSWFWLGAIFAVALLTASLGIGVLLPGISAIESMEASFGIESTISLFLLLLLTGSFFFVKRGTFQKVMSYVLIACVVLYLVLSVSILSSYINLFEPFLKQVFSLAFVKTSVVGGVLATAIRYGIARGVLASDVAFGSTAIFFSGEKIRQPLRLGLGLSLLSIFNTLILCTLTAFVFFVSGIIDTKTGSYNISNTLFGVNTAVVAYENAFALLGGGKVIAIIIFFSSFSVITFWFKVWSKSGEYIFGSQTRFTYKIIWLLILCIVPFINIKTIWYYVDITCIFMILPNLIAFVVLAPSIIKNIRRKSKRLP